jgi:hypothetical protein
MHLLDVDIATFLTSLAMPTGHYQRKSLCFGARPYDAQIEDHASRCDSHKNIYKILQKIQ